MSSESEQPLEHPGLYADFKNPLTAFLSLQAKVHSDRPFDEADWEAFLQDLNEVVYLAEVQIAEDFVSDLPDNFSDLEPHELNRLRPFPLKRSVHLSYIRPGSILIDGVIIIAVGGTLWTGIQTILKGAWDQTEAKKLLEAKLAKQIDRSAQLILKGLLRYKFRRGVEVDDAGFTRFANTDCMIIEFSKHKAIKEVGTDRSELK